MRERKKDKLIIFIDWMIIVHFITAISIAVLGEITQIFDKISFEHGGVEFLYRYLDRPGLMLIEMFLPEDLARLRYFFLIKLFLVIIMSTLFYYFLLFVVLKFAKSLIERD